MEHNIKSLEEFFKQQADAAESKRKSDIRWRWVPLLLIPAMTIFIGGILFYSEINHRFDVVEKYDISIKYNQRLNDIQDIKLQEIINVVDDDHPEMPKKINERVRSYYDFQTRGSSN